MEAFCDEGICPSCLSAKVKKLRDAITNYVTADTQANWKQREALSQALVDTEEK